jgi:hypothetical protein
MFSRCRWNNSPQSSSLATAVVLPPVYTAVTWQSVCMSQYYHHSSENISCCYSNSFHYLKAAGRGQTICEYRKMLGLHWRWRQLFHTIYLFKIHFNIIPPTFVLVFLVISFLLASPQIFYMHSSSPFVLHVLPISYVFKCEQIFFIFHIYNPIIWHPN